MELRKNTNFLYQLNVIDHFSKYSKSYLLFNKNQQSILDKIKDFIDDYGSPIEFGFDNEGEFINKSIEG